MQFAHPTYLYLLLLLIPIIAWYIIRMSKTQASFKLASTDAFKGKSKGIRVHLRHLPFVLRTIAIALIIIVLARPQAVDSWEKSETQGIDIVLALDISGSMLAQDLQPNRMEAVKKVAAEFVTERTNDNIGLVIFAGESFTQCPMTTDHKVLLNLLNEVDFGMIEDGTAIGLGLATSVNRLKDSQSKSKVVILLTDGSNNRGQIAPLTAADFTPLAQAQKVRHQRRCRHPTEFVCKICLSILMKKCSQILQTSPAASITGLLTMKVCATYIEKLTSWRST